MNAPAPTSWHDANQQLLAAEFAALRRHLGDTEAPSLDIAAAHADLPEPAAIDQLVSLFGLSPFERSVLLLAAGTEMDSALARLAPRPSFSLALGALQDAHWSASTPLSPLRAWRLVELDDTSPTQAGLRIDERILHYLAGINQMDARLVASMRPVDPPVLMSAGHRRICLELHEQWRHTRAQTAVIPLSGDDADGQRDIAAAVCAGSGQMLFTLALADIPATAAEQETVAVLWQREVALLPAALLIEAGDLPVRDADLLQRFLQRLRGLTFVTSREPVLRKGLASRRVDKPSQSEQFDLWQQALGGDLPAVARGELREVTAQFRLSAADIGQEAALLMQRGLFPVARGAVRSACLSRTRLRLDELAQRIEPVTGWDDLVLPPAQSAALRQLAAQVRQRARVHGDWGYDTRGGRGLGISALFCGESGVGKTLACEVLAHELGLDLYRIDLSGVVSKYIGETEKNLRRVFDAAEDSGAILLFDEADALFGKRSEVKDSHDRYANIEISYLLQRMESYRGLAVLTSNMRSALDPAFLRRLRFVLQFPFPDTAQREAIWRRAFPDAVPRGALDFSQLARLQVSGGHIRSIALNAAFMAAEADDAVTMFHVAHAAQQEAAKVDKPLGEQQLRGWCA